MTPLSFRDWFVLSVYCAACQKKWQIITINQICNALTGNRAARQGRKNVTEALEAAVLESVKRMMCTLITIDITETCDAIKKYKTDKTELTDVIMPCKLLKNICVNGQITTAILIRDQSPLFYVAELKKQLLPIGTSFLDVLGQNNTPQVVTLKGYIVYRTTVITKHKLKPATMTLADLYEKAGAESKSQKQDVRRLVADVMNHLKTENLISGWEFVRHGNTFHAIKISY